MSSGLSTRLVVSHLLMVVVALGVFALVLAGVADRQATAAGLRADQTAAARLAPWLERYYRERGSWEGLGRVLSDERMAPRAPMPRSPMMRRPGHSDMMVPAFLDQPFLLLAPDGALIAERGVEDREIAGRRHDLREAVVVGDGHSPLAYLFLGSMANPERNPVRRIFLQTMRSAAAITALVVLVAAAAASLVWTHWLVRPLRSLSRATHAMAAGNYHTRVAVPGSRHELTELAASFNDMAAEIESQENSRRRFVADAAHELRTPLALLAARIDMLASGVYQPDGTQWQSLQAGIGRMQSLVGDLQTLARLEAGRLELQVAEVDAGELITQAAAAFEPLAADRKVALHVFPPVGVRVCADPQRTSQVLANLLSNALRHTPAYNSVSVSAGLTRDSSGVEFRVQDGGPGIAVSDRQRIFERFVRLDSARDRESGGSGLGLAIAAELIRRQGGAISVEDADGGHGACFTFTLPGARG
ncbi:MAG: sensor histidine kinase [Spirochaetaceae bacterium]|nr:MAG: sensor histidine kinase [Spirochaetaceae bacterium]